MFNLLRADLYVLVRSRALWIALAASSAMAVGYYASAHLIAVGTYDESISGSVAGFSDAMALPLLGSMLIGVVDRKATRSQPVARHTREPTT